MHASFVRLQPLYVYVPHYVYITCAVTTALCLHTRSCWPLSEPLSQLKCLVAALGAALAAALGAALALAFAATPASAAAPAHPAQLITRALVNPRNLRSFTSSPSISLQITFATFATDLD